MSYLFNTSASYWILPVIIILLAAIVGYKLYKPEGMENIGAAQEEKVAVADTLTVQPEETKEFATAPPETGISEITPASLLPVNDEVRDFAKAFETGADGLDRNFVAAGHHIGINTVGSSLRNANLTLRSDPVIPRVDIGPWNTSTIMPSDIVNRKKLEIGSSM